MPSAGRPEQPLVTVGPVSELAGELRRLRGRADLTYAQLAGKTGLSAATLRGAAGGFRCPTWQVTRAFVVACGGDEEVVRPLWDDACRAAGREAPLQPPADPPDPAGAESAADLVRMLKLLLQWADAPSLTRLNKRAGGFNLLPPSTVSDMLRSQRLPRLELMLAFVRACGLDENQATAWQAAYERIKAREGAPPPAVSQPSGAPVSRLMSRWDPTLTPKEAATLGISKNEYDSAALYARMTVEEHQRLGTSRDHWEPTLILNDHLVAPFITAGEQELVRRLEEEADPALARAQGLVEDVKGYLDEIAEVSGPISSPETGANYSVAEAVDRVGDHDETIERDEAARKHHHRRAGVLLQRLATWAPWLEAVGFLTFVTYYLNVPLLEPWKDWLGWSFALVVLMVIILAQTWLVLHAARSHNHARETYANGHRHEAERGFTGRNRYLWVTAVTAVAITSGIIWRGTAALGNASISTTALMVFTATVTGLLLPTLAYLGIALDGSTVSRERDSLAAALEDDLDKYLQTISNSRRNLATIAEIGDTLKSKTLPDICHATQESVDGVYGFYGTVRLLIGGLAADPPARTTRTISVDAAGTVSGYIGTSIPGAGAVNLGPVFDRQRRLDDMEVQRARLLNRIDALPPPPYGRARTIVVTIRDGRIGRKGGSAGVTPEGYGEILETRDCVEPFHEGDRLALSDGTEVVAIGVDNDLRPNNPWLQTVHVGDVF
jgi:hypothetical protein